VYRYVLAKPICLLCVPIITPSYTYLLRHCSNVSLYYSFSPLPVTLHLQLQLLFLTNNFLNGFFLEIYATSSSQSKNGPVLVE